MFSKVKVGDKLWSIQLGECVVEKINSNAYPITMSNETDSLEYTEDGRLYEYDAYPSLFFSRPFEKMPARQYPVDTLVEVTNLNGIFRRYLKEVTEDGCARVFTEGVSSKTTTTGNTYVYENWRVIE